MIWLYGEMTTPPFSKNARIDAGFRLRQLQRGQKLTLPHSRPMPSIGPNCHELRVVDENVTWRIVYRLYSDAVLILEVFEKRTAKTPKSVIDICKSGLKRSEQDIK